MNRFFAILLMMAADSPIELGRVTLNFRDRPMPEVVRSIGDQSGNPLSLSLAGLSDENDRKITLEAPEPVSFWEAVDRLSDLAGLRSQINESSVLGSRGWSVSLFGPEPNDPSRRVYSGPFRFSGLSLHADHDLDFLRNGSPEPSTTSQTHYAEFDVIAEPRVIAIRTGPLTDLEAVDDQGRSHLASENKTERQAALLPGQEIFRAYPQRLRVDLKTPMAPGGRLTVFRGMMPVELGLIPAQPAKSFELQASKGKTVHVGDVAIEIESLTVKAGEPAHLVLNARVEGDRGDPKRWPESVLRGRSAALVRQIEIADELGPLSPSAETQSWNGTVLRLDYSFSPRRPGGLASPTHLRVFLPEWVTWKAPFSFPDAPLP